VITQVAIDVLARREVSDQHRVAMDEAITNRTEFRVRLRRDWIVAGAGDL
jgi:hypothetical protein